MKFLWYDQRIVREYIRHKRKKSDLTEYDLGSVRYKQLYQINRCFSTSPWGLQHDITGNIPHPFNITTRNAYIYQNIDITFEEVCNQTSKKIYESTDRPIAVLWSGGIDSTCALVSLLQTVPHDQIVVVCNSYSIAENVSFYNDIIKNKIKTMSVEHWALTGDTYFTVSGDGGDAVWAVIDEPAWQNNSDRFNKPWKNVLDKTVAPDFEFIEEFASWSGVEINTWLDLRAWYYMCCKWQDKCTRIYTLRSDLTPADACPFYDFDNLFQSWTMNNLDKMINNSWQQYKMPAKEMIYRYHADKNYLENKSKVESKGLMSKLKQLDVLSKNPMKFVISEDYGQYKLPSWPFLDMYEFENFNRQHNLIPLDVLEK